MITISRNGFKLPYLGKEKFVELMRSGIAYDKARGLFYVVEGGNPERAKATLAEILDDEVVFSQTCLVCKRDFGCADCDYRISCPTRDVPLFCLCSSCRERPNLYESYHIANEAFLKAASTPIRKRGVQAESR